MVPRVDAEPLEAALCRLIHRPFDESNYASVRRCLVDWVGCAVAGTRTDIARRLSTALGLGPVPGSGCVLSSPLRHAAHDAALFNGSVGHALDFDDEDAHMSGHPGTVVIPAVLACAQELDLSGAEVFAGICAGYEVAAHLGMLANPYHYAAGWHATSTLGTIAAAGAVSRTLGLSAKQTGNALSLAATQAAGVRGVFGSEIKAIHAGRAAYAGVIAGKLAHGGITAPDGVLDGENGFFPASGMELDPSLWRSWGTVGPPAVSRAIFKAHAACGGAQCLVEAVAQVVRTEELAPDDVAGIEGRVSDLSLSMANIVEPTSLQDAQFCLPHLAALAVYGYPIVPSSLAMSLDHAGVRALRASTCVVSDPELQGDIALPAAVTVTTRDGRRLAASVTHARGTVEDPLSDDELSEKFLGNCREALSESGAEALLQSLWSFGPATAARGLLNAPEGNAIP